MRKICLWICFICALIPAIGQQVHVEGYTFESNNRGFLNLVRIQVIDVQTQNEVAEVFSNMEGKFVIDLPAGKKYELHATKDLFFPLTKAISTVGKNASDKIFVKMEFERKPGYIFDVTLAEKAEEGVEEVSAIQNVKIEIYNNTKDREELVLENHPKHVFNYTFEDGNHYTVLIRKDGYFTKRLEAYVNIDGCIMCFDGIDELETTAPPVSDNLTAGNKMGTLVANVELEPLRLNKKLVVENIYYNYNSAELRADAKPALDKIIFLLKNNPQIDVELGAHTDSRGSDAYNMKLSQERAASAVKYILENSSLQPDRIQSKGYGESEIVNKCKNGVPCEEWQHKKNRRTEIRITGIRSADEDPWANLSLKEIIRREKSLEEFDPMAFEEQLVLKPGQTLEEALAEQKAKKQAEQEIVKAEETTAIPDDYFTSSTPVPTKNNPAATKPMQSPNLNNTVNKQASEVVQKTATEVKNTVASKPSAPPVAKNKTIEKTTTAASSSEGFKVPAATSLARPPRSIPGSYTGYKIEFFTAAQALPLSHFIFQKHGNIHLDILKDKTHSYLLGDFPTSQSAKKFLNQVMKPQYPKARVIEYRAGGRVKSLN